LLLASGAAGAGGVTAEQPAACEPSGPVDLSVHLVSKIDRGQESRVLLRVNLLPHVRVSSATLSGSIADRGGERRPLSILDFRLPLLRGVPRSHLYELDLRGGEDHHIIFTLEPDSPDPNFAGTSAHVRVNLDPDRQPELRDNLLQYRARMRGL
jgi:hypothetical protein